MLNMVDNKFNKDNFDRYFRIECIFYQLFEYFHQNIILTLFMPMYIRLEKISFIRQICLQKSLKKFVLGCGSIQTKMENNTMKRKLLT